MARVAWTALLRPDKIEEYERSHAAVWPAVLRLIKAAGVHNYSIYRWENRIFGYYECADPAAAQAQMDQGERELGWRAAMEEFFEPEVAERTAMPGVAVGLAWTPSGGDILFVESTRMPGKGGLKLTGSLGEVMRESAEAARSWLRTSASSPAIEPELFEKSDIHIHVPAAAVPKDGPSAGIAMVTSLASMLTGRPVKPAVAMTGEITLRGKVLPVGGIKEKVLAAKRAGIATVVLPEQNRQDVEEVQQELLEGLHLEYVGRIDEALRHTLVEAN